jgi:hypothetical protein
MTAAGEHALSFVDILKDHVLFVFRKLAWRQSSLRSEERTAAYISNSS